MAGAVFGEVEVSLFVAGAVFGEVQVSLFVAGAVFGEVQVSLFVAGAVFGEIWNDSRSAKCCIFQYKMLVVGVKSNLGREAGCGLTVSWSVHARIGRALEMTFKLEQLEVVYQQWRSGIQEFCQTFYVAQGLIRHFSNRRT